MPNKYSRAKSLVNATFILFATQKKFSKNKVFFKQKKHSKNDEIFSKKKQNIFSKKIFSQENYQFSKDNRIKGLRKSQLLIITNEQRLTEFKTWIREQSSSAARLIHNEE